MNKKLDFLLFEENNISSIFENIEFELSDDSSKTKGISYNVAKKVSRQICIELKKHSITNKKAQEDLANLSDKEKTKLNPLGKLGKNKTKLDTLSRKNIGDGLHINPLQISKIGVDQEIGAETKDLAAYAKRGIVPLTVLDKDNRVLASEKDGKAYPYVFFWPIPGALVDEESIDFLNFWAGNKDFKLGEVITFSSSLGFLIVDPEEEIDKIIRAYSSNNTSIFTQIEAKEAQRRGQNEKSNQQESAIRLIQLLEIRGEAESTSRESTETEESSEAESANAPPPPDTSVVENFLKNNKIEQRINGLTIADLSDKDTSGFLDKLSGISNDKDYLLKLFDHKLLKFETRQAEKEIISISNKRANALYLIKKQIKEMLDNKIDEIIASHGDSKESSDEASESGDNDDNKSLTDILDETCDVIQSYNNTDLESNLGYCLLVLSYKGRNEFAKLVDKLHRANVITTHDQTHSYLSLIRLIGDENNPLSSSYNGSPLDNRVIEFLKNKNKTFNISYLDFIKYVRETDVDGSPEIRIEDINDELNNFVQIAYEYSFKKDHKGEPFPEHVDSGEDENATDVEEATDTGETSGASKKEQQKSDRKEEETASPEEATDTGETSGDSKDEDQENTGDPGSTQGEGEGDEDEVEVDEEQFRSELVNLLVEVDKDFQKKADEVAMAAAENKDTRQKVGFGLGAIGGAALGLTAAAAMGPIGLLAFGPAIVAGSTGLGAFGIGTLGGLGKNVDPKGSVKAQIDRDSKTLADEILKLIKKELKTESFVYQKSLVSLLFEQEEKSNKIDWKKIERILNAKGIGPYKAASKGSVSDEQLDEMIAFSSTLVQIIEKNFPVKVNNFNYKFDLQDLAKKREEAARQRETMNMNATTGQPVNAGFGAMIDQLLAQPNISQGAKNQLMMLKIMNLAGGKGIEKISQEILMQVLKEAGNPSKDYDLNKKASEIFGLSEKDIQKLTKKSSQQFSEFPNSETFNSFFKYYKEGLMTIIEEFKTEFKANIDSNYKLEIDKEFLKKSYSFSKINNNKKIIIKERNPLTCILQSLFASSPIEEIEDFNTKSDKITKMYYKYYDKIIKLITEQITLGQEIDISGDDLGEKIKKIFGLKGETNESFSLGSDSLLREEWLRIWEIEK